MQFFSDSETKQEAYHSEHYLAFAAPERMAHEAGRETGQRGGVLPQPFSWTMNLVRLVVVVVVVVVVRRWSLEQGDRLGEEYAVDRKYLERDGCRLARSGIVCLFLVLVKLDKSRKDQRSMTDCQSVVESSMFSFMMAFAEPLRRKSASLTLFIKASCRALPSASSWTSWSDGKVE